MISVCLSYLLYRMRHLSTYGHSQLKTGHPVRSAIHKQLNGRLVLRWVTTWESLLLYVLHFCTLESVYLFAIYISIWCRGTLLVFPCSILRSLELYVYELSISEERPILIEGVFAVKQVRKHFFLEIALRRTIILVRNIA
jgi:hypothetical protein